MLFPGTRITGVSKRGGSHSNFTKRCLPDYNTRLSVMCCAHGHRPVSGLEKKHELSKLDPILSAKLVL